MSSKTKFVVYSILTCLRLLHNVQAWSSSSVPQSAGRYDTGPSKINRISETHDQDFFNFVTRPDIDAPRWNTKVCCRIELSFSEAVLWFRQGLTPCQVGLR